jgi:hypothetical protein
VAKIKHTRNENGQNFTHQNKTTIVQVWYTIWISKKEYGHIEAFFILKIFVLPSENIIPILLENVDNIILILYAV